MNRKSGEKARYKTVSLGKVVHTCNPSTQEAKEERSGF
jgi:hypothetical protein